MKELLKSREEKKKRKPTFIRQDAHKKAEIGSKWRRPKGLQSKMRLHKKGYCRSVEIGWGSPAEVRGLTKDGMNVIKVNNLSALSSLDPKKDVLLILNIGKRNKIQILKEAEKFGLKILNVKDSAAFIKSVEDELKLRKDKKAKDATKKEEKQKTLEKKAKEKEEKETKEKAPEDKKDLSETVEDEVKKKETEKKEQDKILITKKQ